MKIISQELKFDYAKIFGKAKTTQEVQKGMDALENVLKTTKSSETKLVESPLLQEAKKYKSAEEFVKGISDKEIEVPIEMIQPNISPLLRGKKPSMTKGAIEVGYIDRPIEMGDVVGKLRLKDGNHRYYEALERGDKTIKVKFTKKDLLRDDGSMWLGGESLSNFYNQTKSQLTDIWNKAKGELPKLEGTVEPKMSDFITEMIGL